MKRLLFLSQLAVACLLMTGCGQKPADVNSLDDIVASRRSIRDSDELRKLFAIPDDECIMAVISLGYRASDPNRPDRKPVNEVVKFF